MKRLPQPSFFYRCMFLVLVGLVGPYSQPGKSFPLKIEEGAVLRDSEIETVLEDFLRPALQRNPYLGTIRLYIIMAENMNAFATKDREIFFNTGLITTMGSALELISVLYHELGHIAGRHWIGRLEFLRKSQTQGLAALLLGAIAAGLTGNLAVLAAASGVGQHFAYTNFMGYSRTQESSADQFALHTLAALQWPVEGFVAVMEKFAKKDQPRSSILYLRTHPFAQDRLQAAVHYQQQLKAKTSPFFPQTFQQAFLRIKTKIIAYLTSLPKAMAAVCALVVPEAIRDYGKAIVFYRLGQHVEAMEALDKAQKGNHGDLDEAFLQELRCYIYLDTKDVVKAKHALDKALALRPEDKLLAAFKAEVLLMMPEKAAVKEAIQLLKKIVMTGDAPPDTWHTLGVAYGKEGNMGPMRVCFAEEALALGHISQAMFHITQALRHLIPGKPYYAQAQDMKNLLTRLEQEKKSKMGRVEA